MKTLVNLLSLATFMSMAPQMAFAASIDALPFQTPIECAFETGEKFSLEIVDLNGWAGQVNELRVNLIDGESKPVATTLSAISSPAMSLPSPYADKYFESHDETHKMTITFKNEISGSLEQKLYSCTY